MAYSTNLWEKGELISALKLNNIEQGITENDRRLNNLGKSVDVGIYDNETENPADITIPTKTDGTPDDDSRLISARAVRKAIENLDYTDTADSTKYVSEVDEVDGKISVSRVAFNPQVSWQTDTEDNNKLKLGILIANNHSDSGTKQAVPVATTDVQTTANNVTTTTYGNYGVTRLSSYTDPTNVSDAATPAGVWDAINTLDVTNNAQDTNHIIGFNQGYTLASLTQTNGIINATFQAINIDSAHITDRADGTTGNGNVADTVVKTNSHGIIPSQLLPSYVDDVLVYDTYSDFPWNSPSALEQLQQLRAQWEAMVNNGENPVAPTDLDPNDAHLPDGPEKGKIYIAADTGSTYRWYDDGQGNFGYALIGVANLDYNDNGSDTNNGTAATGTSFGADNSKFVGSVTQLDGQIKVIHRDFAPTITWTNGVSGTNDGKPTVNISVGGNSATAVTPGTAGTDVYGITKLSSSTNSSSEVLAATPKAVNDALTAAKSYTDTEIGNLDVSDISGFGANQTLSALSETDGKISASFQAIKIANTDVSGLGTASTKNVAASGNASTTEVVMGNDTRLSDARIASDVQEWAKAANKPSYSVNEITGAAASTNPTFTLINATDVVTFTDGTTSVTFNLAELQALKGMIPTT